LNDGTEEEGVLVIACQASRAPATETMSLCREIATAELAARSRAKNDELEGSSSRRMLRLPRGGEWKARRLGSLARALLTRARFVEQSLLSVEDGLLVAEVNGRIAFGISCA